MRQHPKHHAITALIRRGISDRAIARQLACDHHAVTRIRRSLGIPRVSRHAASVEQKWRSFVRPVGGGHLEWTGERGTSAGTPVMRYREQAYTALRIAFRIRTGHDPIGYVTAECGHDGCVAPDHVEDEPGRARVREQYRYLTGIGERAATCRRGHDQAEHGRYDNRGHAYCNRCINERRAAA